MLQQPVTSAAASTPCDVLWQLNYTKTSGAAVGRRSAWPARRLPPREGQGQGSADTDISDIRVAAKYNDNSPEGW